ncbi:SRPBCC family protein [Methylopila henanensis]|uniref:SRPBCC family protein n=1 Tax=Methylopila henanensis TaxID=873516 RepID=A0ABW4K3V1_9HYPH
MKFHVLAAAAALAVGLAGVAEAHGPTRQKTSKSVEINAAPDKVWAVVGNFQDASWIPIVEKTEGTGGNDKDATRKLTLKDGGAVVEELLTKYDAEKFTYAYRITNDVVKVLPVTNYSSNIVVKGEGDKSTVTWSGAFYRGFPNNDPPPELSDEAALKAVNGLYEAGLKSLKDKVEKGS